ncbi:MAG: Hsp70 family protein [Clostridium sp.]|nr:Hsp70 family protein [Acetatifactor muris]MCM1526786.1 Hsp70 family protein [Bacteroides sp.]MCM1563013.1 Hsp70 family protein [Clostridium sp.]
MILGIDLGTTFSAGAYIDDKGEPQIAGNNDGGKLTPSVVLFDPDNDNEIIVGKAAKDNAILYPENVVVDVKNYMGKNKTMKEYGGKKYTPEMISSFIIRKVVQDSEESLGEKVDGVVITVPAYFSDARRKATEDAATIAGYPLLGMINEPTAAALCYQRRQKIKNENIMIYDLGGGTFDVTILHIDDDEYIEVLSTDGLSNAGGRFFDQCIIDHVRDCIEEKYDVDIEDEEYIDVLQDLFRDSEEAKIELSSRKTTNIIVKAGKIREKIEITRELFEKMISKIYRRTELKMEEALKSANLRKEDIDKVLLVGGSGRIPYIAENVGKFIGKEPSKDINPNEAVALGAAIYSELCGKENSGFVDVCSHSIGVVVVKGNTEENNIVIPKNSKVPIEIEQRFRTIADNQKQIELTVTEGEYLEVTDVTIIGTFQIFLPENTPIRSLVLIKIALDEHQLLHIHIALPDMGFEEEYHMKRVANMDETAIKEVTGILRDYTVS